MNIKYFFRLMFTFNIVFCFNCLAQYPDHPQMPKLTPQSPEAAAMDKYGEYPVSLFTGIPEINIPLYEIKTNKFTLPISLSYHASGIKVNDFASWIGLGWSLNAGGRISRKVQGKDDQTHIRNIRSAGSINSCESSDYLYLQEIANQTDDWDAEADIYMYNFLGRSGKYVYSDTLRATMLPYCGMKTESISFPNKLADELGNIYSFGYPDHQSTEYPDKTGTDPTSSWLLTEMVDAGGTDSMSIDYQTVGTGPLGIDFVDYVTVMDDHYYECPPCINYTTGINTPSSYGIMTYGNEIVPEKISFQNGFVRFIPSDSNRLDRPSYGTYYTGFKSLSEIQIFSFEDTITPIRTIVLYQDYFDNDGDKRLKLDSLKIFDKNLQAIKKYKFDYNTSVKLPSYNSKAKDFWGYYNGKYNDLLLPRMTIEFLGDNGSSTTYPTIGSCTQGGREPDTSYMQAYMLDTITYPTGGYTTFEYETNQYLDSTTSKYAGGLRIHKIKSYTENGISLTKTYKYGEGESGDGSDL